MCPKAETLRPFGSYNYSEQGRQELTLSMINSNNNSLIQEHVTLVAMSQFFSALFYVNAGIPDVALRIARNALDYCKASHLALGSDRCLPLSLWQRYVSLVPSSSSIDCVVLGCICYKQCSIRALNSCRMIKIQCK